jgi:hypothetical protein
MEEKLGIDNITKIFDVLIEAGNVFGLVKNVGPDAHWLDRIKPVAQILDEVYDLLKVDFAKLLPEIKDIDESEKTKLKEHFKIKFDVPQDEVEQVLEESFEVLISLIENIQKTIQLTKKIKGINK